ncbi:uncharacterized protein LOC104689428 isoform X1 [Corvus cornix cornix]|nr:uncharacterized protein LOC104689428 isoform X1 [Corvus cornix cornix]XP_017587016.1 PREDICTED: uncharacterized protein LOC108446061 isoform X1 [Corvus brachyrhynchos]XP_017587017.1 PREDICTED: uncharacterized protein LOC108446061 isoform X1 [Corvus brachyrhynchos]
MAKSDGLLFKYRSPMSPYSLQSHGWWCGTDGARVTSRLFSGPCKRSRPMTCSIVPFEEEASSVTTKKNQGVPLLTIGSSSWLQRGVQLPFHLTAGLCLLLHKLQSKRSQLEDHAYCDTRSGFFYNSAQASEFCLTDQQYLALGEHVPFISVKEKLK